MAARKISDPKPPSFEEEVNELMQPGIIPKLWGKPSAKVMDDPYSRETAPWYIKLVRTEPTPIKHEVSSLELVCTTCSLVLFTVQVAIPINYPNLRRAQQLTNLELQARASGCFPQNQDIRPELKVCAEVERDGRALAHAGPPLKKDKELVLKAVQKDGSALMFASEELQRDKDVVLAAVACDGLVLSLAKDLIGDKEVALVAVAQNGMALRHCAEHLRDDQDVCLVAVQQNGRALRHASEQQQNNKEVVDAALENCTQALPYAGPELKKEWEEILTGRWKDEGWHLERRQAGQILSQIKT
ncbi:unnamed protein product [Cladocopium goreaui]|uniref:DUF4116 domain-containing protein n=1 Tax=Cladocopium goreaui TaxID=2562237 RepID=A0A9P1DJC2_9DINO|nr:unnamed protein product [Cladocopium goreaui]